MSRQIKFRVWDSQIKRFRGSHIAGQKNTVWGLKIDHGIFEIPNGNGLTVQVFTGLLDKNGREIYEGDILQYESHNPQFSKTIVRWTKEDEDNHPGFVVYGSYSQYGQPEVIGNIFENPELVG